MHTIPECLMWSETFVALGTTNRGTCEIDLTPSTKVLKVLPHNRGLLPRIACCRYVLARTVRRNNWCRSSTRERTTPYQEVGYAAFRVVGSRRFLVFFKPTKVLLCCSCLARRWRWRVHAGGARADSIDGGAYWCCHGRHRRHNHRCKSPRDQPSHRRSAHHSHRR